MNRKTAKLCIESLQVNLKAIHIKTWTKNFVISTGKEFRTSQLTSIKDCPSLAFYTDNVNIPYIKNTSEVKFKREVQQKQSGLPPVQVAVGCEYSILETSENMQISVKFYS